MSCNCQKNVDSLIPQVAVIDSIRKETADVATFRIITPAGGKSFDFLPGQCAMISIPPIGEAIFSITSSPTEQRFLEFSIKKCGSVTECLHSMEIGSEVGIRGPYGNHFPVNDVLRGRDLLFIAGGIGLAPLRSVINYIMDNRRDYGTVDIIYGARSPEDLVHQEDIMNFWPKQINTKVHLTVDRAVDGWSGHVGFVPSYIKELGLANNKVALVCGPPIMIKLGLQALEQVGFKREQIYTTLELKMKCGVGKCGRCNIGDKYVCKDGPVFRCDELQQLPDEY